jgi:hypothetical protein
MKDMFEHKGKFGPSLVSVPFFCDFFIPFAVSVSLGRIGTYGIQIYKYINLQEVRSQSPNTGYNDFKAQQATSANFHPHLASTYSFHSGSFASSANPPPPPPIPATQSSPALSSPTRPPSRRRQAMSAAPTDLFLFRFSQVRREACLVRVGGTLRAVRRTDEGRLVFALIPSRKCLRGPSGMGAASFGRGKDGRDALYRRT